MELLWLTVLGVLTVGYFSLAGFDYGTGLLLPFRRHDETLRRMTPAACSFWIRFQHGVGVRWTASALSRTSKRTKPQHACARKLIPSRRNWMLWIARSCSWRSSVRH